MLPLNVVEEIRHLLDAGKLSHRKIAAMLRVSRGTVDAIASGKRGIFGRETDPSDDSGLLFTSPPERCPSCGGMVYIPCLLCQTRAFQSRRVELIAARIADHLSKQVA